MTRPASPRERTRRVDETFRASRKSVVRRSSVGKLAKRSALRANSVTTRMVAEPARFSARRRVEDARATAARRGGGRPRARARANSASPAPRRRASERVERSSRGLLRIRRGGRARAAAASYSSSGISSPTSASRWSARASGDVADDRHARASRGRADPRRGEAGPLRDHARRAARAPRSWRSATATRVGFTTTTVARATAPASTRARWTRRRSALRPGIALVLPELPADLVAGHRQRAPQPAALERELDAPRSRRAPRRAARASGPRSASAPGERRPARRRAGARASARAAARHHRAERRRGAPPPSRRERRAPELVERAEAAEAPERIDAVEPRPERARPRARTRSGARRRAPPPRAHTPRAGATGGGRASRRRRAAPPARRRRAGAGDRLPQRAARAPRPSRGR